MIDDVYFYLFSIYMMIVTLIYMHNLIIENWDRWDLCKDIFRLINFMFNLFVWVLNVLLLLFFTIKLIGV